MPRSKKPPLDTSSDTSPATKRPALALPAGMAGPGIHVRRCRIADKEVVWLRSVLEAYDGLGYLYGDGAGEVLLVSTESQAADLDALLSALAQECRLTLSDPVAPKPGAPTAVAPTPGAPTAVAPTPRPSS